MGRFAGADYTPALDDKRLTKQHERVRDYMLTHGWVTLQEVADATGDPAASVSAQFRHLRKIPFGGFTIERRARGRREDGLYEYRILPPAPGSMRKRSSATKARQFKALLLVVTKFLRSKGLAVEADRVEAKIAEIEGA